MYRILLLTACLLLCANTLPAQYKSPPIWNFGFRAGLDFNNGSPISIQSSLITHAAVSSTQCDAAGNIMFYADGLRIWDKDGNPMPGAINPLWNTYKSGWQLNAMIVPDGADTNRYFVFTIFPSKGELPFGEYFSGQLTYTVVDMRLNNGKGDVVTGQSHILLDTNCGHYITVAPGSSCNYWVIVQSYKPNKYDFKCYEVNLQGVKQTPVISGFSAIPSLFPNGNGWGVGNRAGNLIYSYTRNKLIAGYESADITAYDFSPSTGKVTNPVALTWAYTPTEEWVHSCTIPAICFSPDEQLLYVSGYSGTNPGSGFLLRQFPLFMTGNTLQVGNPYIVFNPLDATYISVKDGDGAAWLKSAMQLGPDNKIYHAFTMGQSFMGRVNNPDIPGAGCNFVPDDIKLAASTYTTSSLPAPMFTRKSIEMVGSSKKDTVVCFQPSLTLHAPPGFTSYQWQDGPGTQAINVIESGLYIVTSMDNTCHQRKDSFEIQLVNFDVSLGNDIVSCFDTVLQVITDAPSSAAYTWSDGSISPTLLVTMPGTYEVSVEQQGCIKKDNVEVNNERLQLSFPTDTTICTGEKIVFDATIDGAAYLWQDGSNTATYTADRQGIYSVLVTKGRCAIDADINLLEEYCDHCLSGVPNAFTPNNDGLNDVFRPVIYPVCPVRDVRFSVYNRFGERVFNSFNPKEGWDGMYKGQPAELGTYFYYLQFTGPQDKKYFHKGDVVLLR